MAEKDPQQNRLLRKQIDDDERRETYAERPMPLPSSSTLRRLPGTAVCFPRCLLSSRCASHAERTCAPIQSAVPFVFPLLSWVRLKVHCPNSY